MRKTRLFQTVHRKKKPRCSPGLTALSCQCEAVAVIKDKCLVNSADDD